MFLAAAHPGRGRTDSDGGLVTVTESRPESPSRVTVARDGHESSVATVTRAAAAGGRRPGHQPPTELALLLPSSSVTRMTLRLTEAQAARSHESRSESLSRRRGTRAASPGRGGDSSRYY